MRFMLCLSALLAAAVPGCGNGDFKDCAVSCTASTGCPDGFTCSAEGLCRIAGAFGECGDNPFPDAPEGDAPTGSVRFGVTRAIETYVVPAGVTELRLVVEGASGGDTGTFVGGFGAVVDTTVTVTPGDRLSIIVGEQPIYQITGMDGCGASGGGGSFVVDDAGDPLAVAGGGGGASGYNAVQVDGGDASISTSGRSSTVAGGTSGNGGSGITGAGAGGGGGGGGLLTSGGTGDRATGGGSFATGAAGGERDATEMCDATAIGGFGGGGGGGRDAGAGGGGYSGGAARDSTASTIKAGGGGSFAAGTSPDISMRTTHGHGSIVITPL